MKIHLAPIGEHRKMNPYRKRENNKLIYVYNVEGTPEQLAEYKTLNPKAITDDKTGKVLMFIDKFVGKTADLIKGEKNWFVDTIRNEQFAAFCKEGGVEYANLKMAELG